MSTQNDFMNLSDVQARSALLKMITGYWTSQAIYVAAKLGIADLLKDGPKSCDSLAKSTLKANDGPKGILFDLPQGVGGAKEYLETADLMGRCEIIEGDFFESIPRGGDAYIFKNIFVNWDDERCINILKNCHHAMAENGKLIIVEVSVISPKNAPSFSKLFDLHMLVMTGGRGRTEAEFQALFAATGFNLTNIIPTESPVSIIEGGRI